jgi:hypothetical protein
MAFHANDTAPVVIGSSTNSGTTLPKKALQAVNLDIYVNNQYIETSRIELAKRFSSTIRDQLLRTTDQTKAFRHAGSGKRYLRVDLDHDLPVRLPIESFRKVFEWMESVEKCTCSASQLPPLSAGNTQTTSLRAMFDCYAATIVLGLRPQPVALIRSIKTKLNSIPITASIILDLHERLPPDDGVITCALYRFFDREGGYSDEEYGSMMNSLSGNDDDFCKRLQRMASRKYSAAQKRSLAQRAADHPRNFGYWRRQ